MRKQYTFTNWILILAILITGCTQADPTAAPHATATLLSTQSSPSAISTMQPAADNWDDRTIFRSGLIQAEQPVLEKLPGASMYHLDVQIADDFASLQGQERVRYTNQEKEPLEAIYFQLFPNMSGGDSTVSAVKVDEQEVQPIYEAGNATVRVPLTTPLQPGQQVVVQMNFQVKVPTEIGGNYGLFGYLENILVLDGFYPAIPVYDEKGWHAGLLPPNADSTFQDASFYTVRVTAPAILTLITSGIQVDYTQQDNRQITTFAAGPARDFYIAASDRFVVLKEKVGETSVNSYAFKERTDGAQLALDTAVSALKALNARFGTYPYTEFDIVSTPMQGATGIEYPGMTGINYTAYDPTAKISGLPAPAILESTVAHEVGHQWFYNVVGNDQANQPWMDEAITQYVTGLYFLDRYGQQGMDGYRSSWLSRWERVNREPIPIGLPADSYQGKEYGAIVYGRGPLFIEALAQKMGQVPFSQFLQAYYQTYQWGIGDAASFKLLAEKYCQCDLTPLFNEWVYKTASPLPTGTPQSAPSLSVSKSGMIAFNSERDGNLEIYLMDADGNNQRRLTSDSRANGWVTWSPDGARIAYHSVQTGGSVLSYLNISTGVTEAWQIPLKGNLWEPAWSHDGQKIAFCYQAVSSDGDIYTIHPDGGELTRLTETAGIDGGPFWSPDDRQIAFDSNRDGNFEVYVMLADGSGQRRLTDNPAEDLVTSWSPDGSRLAFFSNRDGNYNLYVINADGSNLVQLTDGPADEMYPAWSPDGTQIAFISDRDGNFEVYVAPDPTSGTLIKDSEVRRLTNSSARELMPVWMPIP